MKFPVTNPQLLTFIKTNWLILVIVIVAAWLRFWQIDTHAILFSDAGKDLLTAEQAVRERTIPLLGIPSSVPRFKQGPVSIWIEMAAIYLVGANTLVISILFAFLSIVAVIALYEYICITVGRTPAILAAALLAASPLAVAHARVPYHTTPLPLALVLYFFSLHGLKKKNAWFFLLAGISFGFLFQFELAVAPLVLLIPFTIWYQKIALSKKYIVYLCLGLALGVLPQIIFDLSHQFAQLGVFVLWVGHKVLEFITLSGGGSITLQTYLTNSVLFGTRIVSVDNNFIALTMLVFLIIGLVKVITQLRQQQIHISYLLAYVGFLLLTGSYFVHGAPSEAYFPPFLIILPIIFTHVAFSFSTKLRPVVIGVMTVIIVLNIPSIVQHNFFVSNNADFNYGASVLEQRQVLQFISAKSGGSYNLKTIEAIENEYLNYFDNYKWLSLEMGFSQPRLGEKSFYIENKANSPSPTQYFFKDFQTVRVLWEIDG